MAAIPANALVLWNPLPVVRLEESSRPRGGMWAVIRNAILSPSPGRTLDQFYTALGTVLEKQANHAAHALGLGPHVVAEKIKAQFGTDEDRVRQLDDLRTSVPPQLEKRCFKLLKYTLPTESANTQRQSFKYIVNLVTLFPGLRAIFVRAPFVDGATSAEEFSTLWNRDTGAIDPEWHFWKTFAATCLSQSNISTMLEGHRITELTTCGDRGLSVIECLLIGRDCSASRFTGSLCIRYLGGLLNLPGFWLDMGTLHAHVAKKLCCEMVQVLKDIGVDILVLGPLDESEAPFDYEGVDFLATAILTGISSWFGRLEEANQSLQPWYESFAGFLRLLRMPRATELLPHSSATATTSATLEDILPTVNRDARLTVFIDGDNEMEHNQHRVNNDSLVDLRNKNNSIGSIGSHISDQDNTTHSLDSLQEDNDDAQSQDSDMDTVHRTGQKDADNSSSTSDDESYDCSRQCIDDCDDDVPGFGFGLSHGPGSDLIQDAGVLMGQISGAQSVPNAPPYPSLEVRRKAAEEWKVALDQRRRDFGEDHPDTVYAMDYLAYSHMELGEYRAVRDLWVVVYKKRRILQGEDHPDTLRTMGNLAETCRRLGQYEKAEELETGLLEKRRQLLGEDHLDTLLTASNLAATYRGLGRFKEAESLHVQVLEKRKEILGENHPDTLLAMEILAATYLGLGQPKEAESLRIQVLEKWRRILGEDHPDTLKTMCNLAATYLQLGQPKAAEELGVVALEKQSKLLGEDHPHIIVTMANLAVAYYKQGQFDHAEELYIAILQKRRKTLGNDHPDTIEAMHNLATTYRSLGKLQDAEQLEALLGDREV